MTNEDESLLSALHSDALSNARISVPEVALRQEMPIKKPRVIQKNFLRILGRTKSGSEIRLRLENQEILRLRPFAPAGPGDRLDISQGGVSIVLSKGTDFVPLTPTWRMWRNISVGEKKFRITIKEVETNEELEGFKRLTEYHYRGAGGVGRSIPLIASIDCWELPIVVGFVEISSSFLVNAARKRLLNLGFSEPSRNVAWAKWDAKSVRKHTKTIARISRCVVYPELRGLGLSTILADAAVAFTRERWHYGGSRPLFLEITADMLRYFPFVSNCGFLYIGETEGNEQRLSKDMTYLLRRSVGKDKKKGLPKGGGGVLSMQRSYATMLGQLLVERHTSLERLLRNLRMVPEQLSDEEWILLHKVFRRPKPTFMIGLTPRAQALVNRAPKSSMNRALGASSKRFGKKMADDFDARILEVQDVSLTVATTPASSARARKVQEAFGIVSKTFESTLVRSLNFSVAKGEIVLITGPSGTGKSLLLRGISRLATQKSAKGSWPAGVSLEGYSVLPPPLISWLRAAPKIGAPIDLLSGETIEGALKILSGAGLAEPQLFVRDVSQLSEGQSYRLSLALALSEHPTVLFADAFCEPLDRFSAAAVCKRLRALTKTSGLAAVVATANPEFVLTTLQPDRVLVLSSTGDAYWRNPSLLDGGHER